MAKSAVTGVAQTAALEHAAVSAEVLVQAFNEVRAELVSTLFFWLGNHDDAQDATQEAFLKCWRTRSTLNEVQNLRAWIFRVGLNAAKDLQRNAWRRRARPLVDLPRRNAKDAVAIGAQSFRERGDRVAHIFGDLPLL